MTLTDSPPRVDTLPQGVRGRRRIARVLGVLLLGTGVAVCLAVLLIRAGRPVVLAQAAGSVRQIVAAPDGVYWIEDAPAAGRSRLLHLNRVGAEPQVLAQGAALVRFALHDESILLLDAGPAQPSVHSPHPEGRLVRMPRAGGAEEVLVQDLRNPAGLWADAEGIYWTETYAPAAPAAPHVPAAGYVSVIRMLPTRGGVPQLVARIEGTAPQFAGQLLGRDGRELLWLEPRRVRGQLGVTLLRSIPAEASGAITRWTIESDSCGVVVPGGVCATDVSTEASPVSMYASVHRYPSGSRSRELLTDWLDLPGWLLAYEGRVYYVGRRLWEVPESQDWPRPLLDDLRCPDAADLRGGFFYCARKEVRASGGPGAAQPGGAPGMPPVTTTEYLVRWPLTWGARLRALVRHW